MGANQETRDRSLPSGDSSRGSNLANTAGQQSPPEPASSQERGSEATMPPMLLTAHALDCFLRAAGDPVAELRHVGPGHAEFEQAQIIRIAVGVLAKNPAAFPAIGAAIAAFDGMPLAARTDAHVLAAEAWCSGDPVAAAEAYVSITNRWPDDLVALRLLQSCFFFLGWHERLCKLMDEHLAAWSGDQVGFGFLLAMTCFAHAEGGDSDYAESLGRQALRGDPSCPIGVHAVAHAIAASGRSAHGAQWMRDQRAHWESDSRMRTHNAWHLAMFHVEQGSYASALGILDGWLLPASAQSALDACDATALLWRLQDDGGDENGRWLRLSDAFERSMTPGFWPFVDLHAAIAHEAAGQHDRMQRLSRVIDHCAMRQDFAASRARSITQPGLRVLTAWAEGRHGQARELWGDLRVSLGDCGGSHVQLDLFDVIARGDAQRTRWAIGPTHPTTSGRTTDGLRRAA
ncbi:MAG: hypothetical protein K2X67_00175 [Burkholderiales bacterium]|nr:hypothetical protein [Burkholderiales bacterium]